MQEDLEQAFPDLFRNELGDETCLIEARSGWFNILFALARLISEHMERPGTDLDPEYCYFSQIKEKNGHLRVYFSVADPIIDAYIAYAELLSQATCEISGYPGYLHKSIEGGYLKTLAPEVAKVEGFVQA